jgi:hypothetical protein
MEAKANTESGMPVCKASDPVVPAKNGMPKPGWIISGRDIFRRHKDDGQARISRLQINITKILKARMYTDMRGIIRCCSLIRSVHGRLTHNGSLLLLRFFFFLFQMVAVILTCI